MRLWLGWMALVAAAASAAESAGPRWELAWADEFDRDGAPDPARWTYEHGNVRNHEKQFYTRERAENARVEKGNLILEARKDGWEGHDVTSASLTTQDRVHILRGRVEVRAQLPSGRGTWPAIWMLGIDIRSKGWPACGEIDIMENVGFEPGVIHGTVHTRVNNHTKGTAKGSQTRLPGAHDGFHVYALEWFADRMDFFVDDRRYFTYRNDGGGEGTWPFERPAYLLLNLAIGGAWGGQKGVDDAIFPQRMTVDYVRVYRDASTPGPANVVTGEAARAQSAAPRGRRD